MTHRRRLFRFAIAGLFLLAVPAAAAAYPGADGRIALTCESCRSLGTGSASRVVTLSRDGRDVQKVRGMQYVASWSPDGRWLVGSIKGSGGIWLVSADGGLRRQLTDPAPAYDSLATFSGDGSRLAFLRGDGVADLYVLALDGSAPVRVAERFAGRDLVWSPTNDLIAFTSQASGDRGSGIAVIDAAGGPPREIARGWRIDESGRIVGSGSYSSPEWAPDGQRIAPLRWQAGPGSGTADLVVMRADGRDRRVLARRLTLSGGLAWAPSGKSILAPRARFPRPGDNAVFDLVEIELAGGGERTLRRGLDYLYEIAWQPRPSKALP